jgi:toxin ParE1/3/4
MKILWTEPSLNDLRAIRDYIAKDSETYAANFVESILSAVEQVSEFPRMGRIVPEADIPDIRELVFRGYRVIYQVHESAVHVLAVLHGYRDLSGMSPKPWEA